MERQILFKPSVRNIISTLLLSILLIILLKMAPLLINQEILKFDDFVEYWAAGQLNLIGGNPYNPAELLPLQLRAGRQHGVPVMMWNPPWTLPLVMPFGSLDYPLSRFFWFLSHTAILVFCAFYLWRFYGGSQDKAWVAILISLTFLPSLFALKTGQIPALLLLGMVLFLMWTERQTWWLLSLAILLITIKPHTLYLMLVAFFFWSFSNRRWGLLASAGMGIALCIGISLIFNPLVLQQYFYALGHHPPSQWATPTIGGMLRYFFGIDRVWLQFLPTFLGLLWFCLYWWKARLRWKWSEQIPLLMTVSVLTASYGWTCDYLVLLLPILFVTAAIMRQGISWIFVMLIILYIAIDMSVLIQVQQRDSNDFWLMWLAPALSGWYLLAVRWGLVAGSSPAGAGKTLGKNFPTVTVPRQSSG